MKYFFIAFLLYKNLHSSHTNLKSSARRLFWNLCFKRSESWPTSHQTHLETLLFALQTLPQLVRIFDISFTIQFRMPSPCHFYVQQTTKFISLDWIFISAAVTLWLSTKAVFSKAWTPLRDRRLAWSDNLTKVCAVSTLYQEVYKWDWLRSINIHCNLRWFKSFPMQVTTSCKQKSWVKISPQNGIIAPLHTYIYERCKKSRQKQLGKVQWRRRVFAN